MHKFRGDSSLEYFVKRICINRCIDRVRKQVRERGLFSSLTVTDNEGAQHEMDVEADEGFDPVAEVARSERGHALMAMLAKLDEDVPGGHPTFLP